MKLENYYVKKITPPMEIKHNACRPKIKRMSAIAGWKSLGDRDVLDQTRAQHHVTANETLAAGTQTAVVLAQLATGDTTQHDVTSTQVCAQVRCLMIALTVRAHQHWLRVFLSYLAFRDRQYG